MTRFRRVRLLGHLFVEVAPEPALVGLGGGYDGVLGAVEVLGGVLVLRGVAAAYVSALEAGAEVNPGVAQGYAFVADVGFGGGVVGVAEVFAEGHGDGCSTDWMAGAGGWGGGRVWEVTGLMMAKSIRSGGGAVGVGCGAG